MHHTGLDGTNWQLNTKAFSTSSTAMHVEPATSEKNDRNKFERFLSQCFICFALYKVALMDSSKMFIIGAVEQLGQGSEACVIVIAQWLSL